jgi:hypothetical protein
MSAMPKKKVKVNIRSKSILPTYTDEELTELAERIGMTLDQLKRYGRACYSTYGAISADLHNMSPLMKRYNVVECTLDADHIEMYGRLDKDLIEWRRARWLDDKMKLEDYYAAVAAISFPYPVYE